MSCLLWMNSWFFWWVELEGLGSLFGGWGSWELLILFVDIISDNKLLLNIESALRFFYYVVFHIRTYRNPWLDFLVYLLFERKLRYNKNKLKKIFLSRKDWKSSKKTQEIFFSSKFKSFLIDLTPVFKTKVFGNLKSFSLARDSDWGNLFLISLEKISRREKIIF